MPPEAQRFILETLPPPRGRAALLVVDEDEATANVCQNLELFVVTAANLEDAARIGALNSLSAALVDVQVTDDPHEAVERIRAAARDPRLPIFFTSSDGSLKTRLAASAAGGALFLDKPLTESKLAELLGHAPFAEPFAARIVIVDDDPIVLERYESELEAFNYHVRSVEHPQELVEALEDVRPDVLLLDVNLGDVSGIDVCRALRCSPRWRFLPILVFSSDDSSEMRVEAYQAGATDVLSKPLDVKELMTRVHVQAERIQAVRRRSDLDPLSGLTLRRAFTERARTELKECRLQGKPFSLALFDIDLFKQINDHYGHLVGDRVISAFGAILRKRFGAEELRCRWGGEEFLLAFPGEDALFAQQAAERVLKDLSRKPFETDDGRSFIVTCTAGVAEAPRDGITLEGLVKRADQHLYHGKESGRARVCGPRSLAPDERAALEGLGLLVRPAE